MVKQHIPCIVASLRARRRLALAPLVGHSRARSVPVHPCTGRRPANNGVLRQPASVVCTSARRRLPAAPAGGSITA